MVGETAPTRSLTSWPSAGQGPAAAVEFSFKIVDEDVVGKGAAAGGVAARWVLDFRLWRHREMHVAGHEAIGFDAGSNVLRLFLQQAEAHPAVLIGEKRILPVVAPLC